MNIWLYSILSVLLVSLVSLVGILTFSWKADRLKRVLVYLVSLSAGTLLGDAFLHLIPETFQGAKNFNLASAYILSGIFVFFVLEKIIHWRHCHEIACEDHPHPFSHMILIGDSVHNFIDGLIIGASFLASIPVGIATTIAVILHEIPQEIGDFGSLVYSGIPKGRAILYNFLTALFAVLGTCLVLATSMKVESLTGLLIPFAAGGFIYIASSDLIPELKKHWEFKVSLGQIGAFLLGIGFMFTLLFLE